MQIEVLKSKIHRVKVTEADLNYVGSVTIDADLMDAAGMLEHEKVDGERLQTYIIKAERGSGVVGINGPAAKKASVGDIIIIVSYAMMELEDARKHQPTVLFPDDNNRIPS